MQETHLKFRESSRDDVSADFCRLNNVAPVLRMPTHRSRPRSFVISLVDLLGRQCEAPDSPEEGLCWLHN